MALCPHVKNIEARKAYENSKKGITDKIKEKMTGKEKPEKNKQK